jgi:hypothetical protein
MWSMRSETEIRNKYAEMLKHTVLLMDKVRNPDKYDDVNVENIQEHINSENEQHSMNSLMEWVLSEHLLENHSSLEWWNSLKYVVRNKLSMKYFDKTEPISLLEIKYVWFKERDNINYWTNPETVSVVRDSSAWWNSLDSLERDEYFIMYYRDMKRGNLLRICGIDELESDDIEQIYNDYYL